MSNCYSQTIQLSCPECGNTFEAEIWLIIDAIERPDLLERTKQGGLHNIPCSNCKYRGSVDAPLLLYRANMEPKIVFSPARGTTEEQEREQVSGLLGYLDNSLGEAWRDEWILQLVTLPRHELSFALTEGFNSTNWKVGDPRVDKSAQRNGISAEFQVELRQAQRAEQRYLNTSDRGALDQAIASWERILGHPKFQLANEHLRLIVLNNSGGTYLRRYWISSQIEDLNRALSIWQKAVELAPEGSPERASILNNLSNGLRDRYARIGKLEDLESAIMASQQAVAMVPEDAPNRAGYLTNLGNGLRDRFGRLGQLGDLQGAVEAYEQAVESTPEDALELDMYLNNLGNGLSDQYSVAGQLGDLQRAIDVYKLAVALTSEEDPNRGMYLSNLGNALMTRYERTGKLEHLESAIEAHEHALVLTPDDALERAKYSNNLGIGLNRYYARTGQLSDLQVAIDAFEEAVALTPEDAPNKAMYLNNLGNGLRNRYARLGQADDLEAAIGAYKRALALTPEGSPNRAVYITNLGDGLDDRYVRTGQIADLHAAIEALEQAVALTPEDAPDRAMFLDNLGNGLRNRYSRMGQIGDLQTAIELFEQAVALTPEDSPSRAKYLNNLGNGLRDRYSRMGQIGGLQDVIGAYEQAVELTPDDSPELATYLANLGIGLSDRYKRIGQIGDLEAAIGAYEQAVDLTPDDSPELARYLNNLGIGLSDRYERTGQIGDLEAAIGAYEQAVDLTPDDSPELARHLTNLGNGLSDRYARMDQVGDLQAAIEAYERAVALTPGGTLDLPGRLTNLGTGLRVRYRRTGELKDLQTAIKAFEQAVALTPEDTLDMAGRLTNLGNGLHNRYECTEKLEDLQAAIKAFKQAVMLTTEEMPARVGYLNNLAAGLRDRYSKLGGFEDLQAAIEAYREACLQGLQIAIIKVLNCSYNWGIWALERQAWDEAVEAFSYGMQATERLVKTQLLRSRKETWLRDAQGIPALAAYAHTRGGNLVEALEVLENGQARLFSEVIAFERANLLSLKESHPDLVNHYRQLVDQIRLHHAVELQKSENVSLLAVQLKTAAEQLDDLIEEIRCVEGYEDFLQPIRITQIKAIAETVTLIYLAVTLAGGLALVVSRDDILPVWLEITTEELESLLVKREDDQVVGGYLPGQFYGGKMLEEGLEEILTFLGKKVLSPIFSTLKEITPVSDQLVLIPSGKLGLVPLQAAPAGEDEAILDCLTVSYAPTAQALQASIRSPQQEDFSPTLVGIGNPLPGEETGEWARNQLSNLLPAFREYIRSQQNDEQDAIIQELGELSKSKGEVIVQSGLLFWSALALFQNAPAELIRGLVQIVERIPVSLPYAQTELKNVADLLPAEKCITFYGEKATREALLEALPSAELLHLSCHGAFNTQNPQDTALILAQETKLALCDLMSPEWFAALTDVRLVVLSACQTAVTEFNRLPDEAIGLPVGFMAAGVPTAIGALWSVNDRSTALLMTHFYELYLNGDNDLNLKSYQAAESLRQSQIWLRDITNLDLDDYLEHHWELKRIAGGETVDRMSSILIREERQRIRKAVEEGEGENRPYHKPYHWAGFVCYGF